MGFPANFSRRSFIRTTAAAALAFGGVKRLLGANPPSALPVELIADPKGILDLPKGFTYKVVSRAGETMRDNLVVPAAFDGMGAFAGPGNTTILIRNHELAAAQVDLGAFGKNYELLSPEYLERLYDKGYGKTPQVGGTTTVILDTETNTPQAQFLSLGGTVRNCAGGITPWDSWITCEETTDRTGELCEQNHGYAFEVPSSARLLVNPIPLAAMGRFRREAVAVDPSSGIVYQTEDTGDGLIYRFIPVENGKLAMGGKLQALCLTEKPQADTRNWEKVEIEQDRKYPVRWIDLDDVESPLDDLRIRGFEDGAACFARGEGMIYSAGSVYFVCTDGGAATKGQIWKYTPATSNHEGDLELVVEASKGSILENGDNIAIAPWGDLIVCEDKPADTEHSVNYLLGVTPKGELYRFAKNALNKAEFAGATFSPDGLTLFVNIFTPGLTLAIRGDWGKLRS